MKPARVAALVFGVILLVPGVAVTLGGGALGLGYAFGRNDDGYFELDLDRLQSPTAAISSGQIDFLADPGTPGWLIDRFDLDVRLDASRVGTEQLFVGVGPEPEVSAWLGRTAYDEVVDIDDHLAPEYDRHTGTIAPVATPADQDFWVATAVSGDAAAVLDWEATDGSWVAVVANTDGSPGVAADLTVGAKSGLVLPVVFLMLGFGVLLTAVAVGLIVVGTHGAGTAVSSTAPSAVAGMGESAASQEHPVAVSARLDPELSRWMWLVKWFLAIPHYIVLLFLWVGFAVATFVAGVAILFTGRYPQRLWEFNLGVLRWTWRVNYYASTGGLGTDRYPPFSLGREPDYPAVLDIAYPEKLSRGLVLVKWWLLAIPHYLIIALLTGSAMTWSSGDGGWSVGFGGLLGVLTLITGAVLLFTDRYPRSLFDLIVGFNRWIFRVVAYVALMTDRYPPFRLDQGGIEPGAPLPPPPTDLFDRDTSAGTDGARR